MNRIIRMNIPPVSGMKTCRPGRVHNMDTLIQTSLNQSTVKIKRNSPVFYSVHSKPVKTKGPANAGPEKTLQQLGDFHTVPGFTQERTIQSSAKAYANQYLFNSHTCNPQSQGFVTGKI